MNVVTKELKIQGFTVSSFKSKFDNAMKELKEWVDTVRPLSFDVSTCI